MEILDKTDIKYQVKPDILINVILSEKNNKGGTFTIVSKKTGKHYTYRIARKEYNKKWFTHIYVMYDYMDFKHLGVYSSYDNNIYKKKQIVTSESAKAISWLLTKIINKYDKLDENIELYHTGKCVRCGRDLTDPISIENGIGPVCINLPAKKSSKWDE